MASAATTTNRPSITFLASPAQRNALGRNFESFRQRLGYQRSVAQIRHKKNAKVILTNAARVARHPVLSLVSRVSRQLRTFLKGQQTPIARYASSAIGELECTIKDLPVNIRTKSPGKSLQRMLKRLRNAKAVCFVSTSYFKPQVHRRRHLLMLVYVGAMLISSIRRFRRRCKLRGIMSCVAATFVRKVMTIQTANVFNQIMQQRSLAYRKVQAAIIERAWCAWRERRKDLVDRKRGILMHLSSGLKRIRSHEILQLSTNSFALAASLKVILRVLNEFFRQWSAKLIQRTWRHYRRRLVSSTRYKRQRIGLLSRAGVTLLDRGAKEPKMIIQRVARRGGRSNTSIVQSTSTLLDYRIHSVSKPVPRRSPPRYSFQTGTKVIPVTIWMYKRMLARRARVNPMNVWVAIPIGYQEATKSHNSSAKRNLLKASCDWIPSTLLSLKVSRTLR